MVGTSGIVSAEPSLLSHTICEYGDEDSVNKIRQLACLDSFACMFKEELNTYVTSALSHKLT